MLLLATLNTTQEQYIADTSILQSLQISTMAWSNHYTRQRSLIALGSRSGAVYLFFFENDTLQCLPAGLLPHSSVSQINCAPGTGVAQIAFSSTWQHGNHTYTTMLITALTDGAIYLWNVNVKNNDVSVTLRETVSPPDGLPITTLSYAQPVSSPLSSSYYTFLMTNQI